MKFNPILKEKIWGGQKISKHFGMIDPEFQNCGEMWALSAVDKSESEVSNGHFAGNTLAEMSEIFMDDFIGEQLYQKYNTTFPLLLKIIDANDYLSVQVHPNDAIAKEKHGLQFGKSEMWYVIQADAGAHIIAGFNQPMTKDKLLNHIAQGTVKEILNYEPMQSGDFVYIPSGMVHAMGPGLLIAEIQQTSDITYRLNDWERLDDKGNSRELHIDEAVDAINYEIKPKVFRNFNPKINQTTPMISSPYFSTSYINLTSIVEKNLEEMDSFVIYFSVSGSFELHFDKGKVDVAPGECVLVPAITEKVFLLPSPSAHIIEIFAK